MERPYIITGALEAKVSAEIAEIQKQFRDNETNYDYLLGHLKYKRPSLVLPKISGVGCPLQRKSQNLYSRIGFYQLTAYDSEDESTAREHDYCNLRYFIGFTHSEIIDSVQRYFLSRDSEFLVATEMSFPEDEPKEPLHIKIELSESELIRAYDHETHYGYLLDPDFKVDEVFPASVEELGAQDSFEEMLNAKLTRNYRPCEMIPRSSTPQNVFVNDSVSDEQEGAECVVPITEEEEEEESAHSFSIVNAGDLNGEFIGDTYHRCESRMSRPFSLPNFYPESCTGRSFSRPSSIKGFESDALTICTSGLSLLDIDSDVHPSLGKVYGHYPGIEVNFPWTHRLKLSRSGCHRPLRGSIHIGDKGAYSLLLHNALVVEDFGDSLILYGEPNYKSTAKNSKTRRSSSVKKRRKKSQKKCDQTMTGGNLALYCSFTFGNPIRVVRSHTMKNAFSPSTGYRYEGLFYVHSIRIVMTYQKIREFRFILISEPDFFASREAPALWRLEGKFPRLTPRLMNFGHPRGTILGRGCRESVRETSRLWPAETVGFKPENDTRRRAPKRATTDSKREEQARRARSVSSRSGVQTRSGRRSSFPAARSVASSESVIMELTSTLDTTMNTAEGETQPSTLEHDESMKVHPRKKSSSGVFETGKRQRCNSVRTAVESDVHHINPAESVKIYPRKRPKPATETAVCLSELDTATTVFGDNIASGLSGSELSLTRVEVKKPQWLQRVERWIQQQWCDNPKSNLNN